jgi:hypothetical protein
VTNEDGTRASLIALVEAVRKIPYGRPSDRSVEGMLREQRGTCSTKHLYLAQQLAQQFPLARPQIMHRVYRLDRDCAEQLFGTRVAETIPPAGLVDVHRYLRITLDGRTVIIDATFPGEPWDGQSSMPLTCGAGTDIPCVGEADREKRDLEARHCDPAIREPFIAILTARHPQIAGTA